MKNPEIEKTDIEETKKIKIEEIEKSDPIFAERLMDARKKLKLSTRELAKKADVSYSLISAIETERSSNVRVKNAMKLALALNVTVEHLLGLDDYLDNIAGKDTFTGNGVSAFEKMILQTYKFPNGMTYAEMDEKIKEMKELEEKMTKIESIFNGDIEK